MFKIAPGNGYSYQLQTKLIAHYRLLSFYHFAYFNKMYRIALSNVSVGKHFQWV